MTISISTEANAAEFTEQISKTKSSQDSVVQNTSMNILNKSGDVPTGVASVLGCSVSDSETYHLIFGEELASYGIVLKTNKDCSELETYNNELCPISTVKLSGTDTVDISNSVLDNSSKQAVSSKEGSRESTLLVNAVEDTIKEVENKSKSRSKKVRAVITHVDQSNALLSIDCADENYTGAIVTLTPEDRDILERLVMGEAGGEGYEGAALVAQAIRDTMVYRGFGSVNDVRIACKYSGSLKKTPNQNVKDAVAYVFDQGGIVVKHPIFYFYAPGMVRSSFHESQKFIIEHGGHRFFSTW